MIHSKQTIQKVTTRDVMTIAAMMTLSIVCQGILSMITLPIPSIYLYLGTGLSMFFTAIFYLVVANRLNKHGIFIIWGMVNGVLYALSGYVYLLPFFIVVAFISEGTMIGKNSYRKPIRNAIAWAVYGVGMVIGNAVPMWVSWETFKKQAINSGYTEELFEMQAELISSPQLMIICALVTAILSVLGCLMGNRILQRHFKKAGVV